MADEHDTTSNDDTDADDSADETDAAHGSADEDTATASDGDATEEAGDAEDDLKRARQDMPGLNRRIPGRLTLVYPDQTVVIRCDGDAALRVLAMVAGSPAGGLQDRLDPWKSPAINGWMVIDPDPLAAFWEPTWGADPLTAKRRLVVDPVPTGLTDPTPAQGLLVAS